MASASIDPELRGWLRCVAASTDHKWVVVNMGFQRRPPSVPRSHPNTTVFASVPTPRLNPLVMRASLFSSSRAYRGRACGRDRGRGCGER
jgi:hypothetical protein